MKILILLQKKQNAIKTDTTDTFRKTDMDKD